MDVRTALRRRRMVRAFDGTELSEEELVAMCADALRAPTAGNARGVEVVVLAGARGVERYLNAATDAQWRAESPRAPGLAKAGAAVVVLCAPAAYTTRYAAADKSTSGLDVEAAWPVPYWFGDAGGLTMALLLVAEALGHAACFLGAFRNEQRVLDEVRAPAGRRLYGTVLLGRGDPRQVPSRSLAQPGPTRAQRVVRGEFPTG